MVAYIPLLAAAGAAAGFVVIRAGWSLAVSLKTASVEAEGLANRLDQAVQSAERAEQARVELEAELARVRERRHTHATTEMIEDAQAVILDSEIELRQAFKYLLARLRNANQILQSGRPGPNSYTPATTDQRPARPGAGGVKLWQE